jgi:hypothetical protein
VVFDTACVYPGCGRAATGRCPICRRPFCATHCPAAGGAAYASVSGRCDLCVARIQKEDGQTERSLVFAGVIIALGFAGYYLGGLAERDAGPWIGVAVGCLVCFLLALRFRPR